MQACCSAPPHDNVCRLLGWGSPDTADGSLTGGLKDDAVIYMVLEDAGEEVDTTYSPEESLRCFKQIVSGPPPRPIFALFSAFSHADACVHAGVRHAHGRGFYHRNLKVENVARMKSGAVKLIRLGHSQGVAPGRTHANSRRGSRPAFEMSRGGTTGTGCPPGGSSADGGFGGQCRQYQ